MRGPDTDAVGYHRTARSIALAESMSKASNAASPLVASPVIPLEDLPGYQLRRASQAMLNDLIAALDDLSLRPTAASNLRTRTQFWQGTPTLERGQFLDFPEGFVDRMNVLSLREL